MPSGLRSISARRVRTATQHSIECRAHHAERGYAGCHAPRSSKSPAAHIRSKCCTGRWSIDEGGRRDRPDSRRGRRRRGGLPPGSGRCARVPADRARHPRSVAQAPRPQLARRQARHSAALCPPLDRRAEPRLSAARRAANRAGHERRRVVADRAGHSLRRRYRHGPRQPLLGPQQSAAAADRGGVAGFGRPAQGALRPHRAGRVHSPVQRGRLS